MSVKVAINGFGRIGRLAFRQMFGAEGYEVVAINDLTSPKMLAHLLKYDSTQGNYSNSHTVEAGEDNIVVDGKKITIYAKANAAELPWGELGVDVVLECTGFYTSKAKAQAHIDAGAKKVVISAPAGNDLPTIVYNVNTQLAPGQLGSVGLGVNGDLLAVDSDEVLAGLNDMTVGGVVALGGIVLQQVSQHLGRGQVVDRDDFKTLGTEHLTESQTADTAKTIDCNFNRHGNSSIFITAGRQYFTFQVRHSISPYGIHYTIIPLRCKV